MGVHARESPIIEVRKSGNSTNLRLTACPICLDDLEDASRVCDHIADHSWDDLMAARERQPPSDTAAGQLDPDRADDRREAAASP